MNSGEWATADFAAWNSQYLSLLRPLWLILVSPLCLPELQATSPSPLSFWISAASSNRLRSPISAIIPDRMFSPIPDISSMFSAWGIEVSGLRGTAPLSAVPTQMPRPLFLMRPYIPVVDFHVPMQSVQIPDPVLCKLVTEHGEPSQFRIQSPGRLLSSLPLVSIALI